MDKCGETWAKQNNIPVKHFPADWSNIDVPNAIVKENEWGKYNARAGVDRNKIMAKYADNAVVVIKDGSSGSDNMIQEMEKLGKEVFVYEL